MTKELSNTTKRVVAGLALLILLLIVFFLGDKFFVFFVSLIGLALVDETIVNIFKVKRFSINYLVNIVTYVICTSFMVYAYYFYHIEKLVLGLTMCSLLLSLLSTLYLFLIPIEDHFILGLISRIRIFWSIYFFLNIALFVFLIYLADDKWIHSLMLMFIVCFATDTGAWFFGKNFGKKKLWPSVSPNKTVEGLIGGVFLSGVLSSFYYIYFLKNSYLWFIFFFPVLSVISHLGDLFQSKIKRQCGVKNSSSLIPGHGGVYDRLDSVLFLIPFYLVVFYADSIF